MIAQSQTYSFIQFCVQTTKNIKKTTLAVYIFYSTPHQYLSDVLEQNYVMGLLIQQSSVRHFVIILIFGTLGLITLFSGILKHQTKSFELQKYPKPDQTSTNSIILYNRIPKTGSTTLANIFNGLSSINKFWAVNINSSYPDGKFGNALIWPVAEQREFLINITTSEKHKKAIYHGHFGFISAERWQVANADQITYINLIRNPLDRLSSYYYFVRNGDNFRKGLKRGHAADHRSINECVAETLGNIPEKKINKKFNEDCSVKTIWKQIPMFCGQFSRCNDPESREWAYNQAVQNLYKKYSVVGYTEKYIEFIKLLEETFPEFFSDALKFIENSGGLEKLSLRQTNYPDDYKPNSETISLLESTDEFRFEMKFYELVKSEFDEAYKRAFDDKFNGKRSSRVNYNKIYGPDGRFKGKYEF